VSDDNGPAESGRPEPAAAATAGALLRAAREKQGLHIAALAAAIKVSPRKLEALEADRHGELPDATFIRALAQTVCRTLKIDPRPVLERLPAAGPHALLPPDEGLNEPFRPGMPRVSRPGARSAPGAAGLGVAALLRHPMVWGALLLLLASVALYFAPLEGWLRPVADPTPVALPGAVPVVVPPVGAASAPLLAASAAEGVASRAAAQATAPLASAPDTPTAPGGTVETVFSAPPAGSTPAPVAGALQLRVREASWVEVRDARGAALLSRLVQPGEQLGLDGATPLSLVVGNAAATELVFRGQPVDLAARTRDNVARLQLP
jgi:cytoskeleton protein RodZ